jgi:hypothetical protein
MVKFGVDGRTLTDYRPSCDVENMMKAASQSRNNNEYRMFLQRHAEVLMSAQRQEAHARNLKQCNCPQCVHIANK